MRITRAMADVEGAGGEGQSAKAAACAGARAGATVGAGPGVCECAWCVNSAVCASACARMQGQTHRRSGRLKSAGRPRASAPTSGMQTVRRSQRPSRCCLCALVLPVMLARPAFFPPRPPRPLRRRFVAGACQGADGGRRPPELRLGGLLTARVRAALFGWLSFWRLPWMRALQA